MAPQCHNATLVTYTNGMEGACQEGGRVRQKARTRKLLMSTAVNLAVQGKTPTVTEVADAAEVSRRTAYRYFPTQQQLLVEASLEMLRPQVERLLSSPVASSDPNRRLDTMVRTVQRLTVQHEELLRAMVRLSMERRLSGQEKSLARPVQVRGTRRVQWIEAALAPIRKRLRRSAFERLVSALAFCVGIEPLIVLRDIRGLGQQRAINVSRWAARVLLEASLRDEEESNTH
jgi:AcrR family transcriptional regulator